jgi:hypothetical protein
MPRFKSASFERCSIRYITALCLAATVAGVFQAQAAEQPTFLEAATFVMMAEAENAGGVVKKMENPCILRVRKNLVEDNPAHTPYSAYKQIHFGRVQQVRIERAPGSYSTQRLTISGDPGTYCQGFLYPEDPERDASARRSRNCSNEMILYSNYTRVPLERVAKAVLYISQNFCPYSGKPY